MACRYEINHNGKLIGFLNLVGDKWHCNYFVSTSELPTQIINKLFLLLKEELTIPYEVPQIKKEFNNGKQSYYFSWCPSMEGYPSENISACYALMQLDDTLRAKHKLLLLKKTQK